MSRLLFILFFLLSSLCSAQTTDLIKMTRNQLVPGSITFQDGKTLTGYIKDVGSMVVNGKRVEMSWKIQGGVYFMMDQIFHRTEEFNKDCFLRLRPRDLEKIVYNGTEYRKLRYFDISNEFKFSGQGRSEQVLVKVKKIDRISIYEYFYAPSVFAPGPKGIEPIYLWTKGDDIEAAKLTHLNPKKVFADCPAIVARVKEGKYIPIDECDADVSKFKLRNVYRKEVMLMAVADYNLERCF